MLTGYADERLLPHLRSVPVLGGGVVGGAACDRADPSQRRPALARKSAPQHRAAGPPVLDQLCA
jgi:hypothetical protein